LYSIQYILIKYIINNLYDIIYIYLKEIMYGGASKPESYCKITVYLQHNAPLLYENIQDLCLFGAFNARGRNGVTFLLPDKKTQEKIDKLVGQDARKAVAMINACVLPVYLENIEAFRSHQDDIPNKLGNKLPIKEVTSSSVELSNGAKISRDSKFKRLHDDSNVAVYTLDGEVPTTGEASQAPNKKKGSRGHYKGGNDDFNDEHTTKSGTSWTQVVDEAALITVSRLERGGIDHLTHLTISLLNFMLNSNVSTPELKELGALLVKVMPVSPLYCLFILPLMKEEEVKMWLDNPQEYNKMEKLKEFMGMGLCMHDQVDKSIKNRDTVVSLQATNICTELINHAGKIRDVVLGSDYTNVFNKRFGGPDGFKHWICSLSENTFLYSTLYVRAVDKKDGPTVKLIIDSFIRFVAKTFNGNWKETLVLLDPDLDTLYTKERFCTILSLFVSHRFFPMGCKNLNDLASIGDGTHNNVTYGGSLAPNLVVPTSDEHITAEFWVRTIKD